MKKNIRIVDGPIFNSLVRLALPIMGTSFVQMAYSLTDMVWIGMLGNGSVGRNAVAAVGTAGFYTWLAEAFMLIPRIGAGVGIAQAIGRKDVDDAKSYIRHSIQLVTILGLLYGIIMILFRNPLIGFFKIDEPIIVSKATNYLTIVSIGIVFYFINPVFTAILNAYGDSKTPFIINTVGLIMNIVLDPLLILGPGPLPKLGVEGAAIATITAQFTVTLIFIIFVLKKSELFKGIDFFKSPDIEHMKRIIRLGTPAALQSGLYTIIAMVIGRMVASFGPIPMAVQNVGSQIESISWLTAGGFQTAISTFVGQNYGAKKWDRVYKGYFAGISIVTIVGIFTSLLLIFFARPIFTVFIREEETIKCGIDYLRILGLSQLFMCLEISTAGAFNGVGRTVPPSVVSITLNALRIPGAMILTSTALGINGIWWSISLSSIFKGIILVSWFLILLKRNPKTKGMKLFKHKEINEAG